MKTLKQFPSPCGVLMILIVQNLDLKDWDFSVSVPMRGFNDFNLKLIYPM